MKKRSIKLNAILNIVKQCCNVLFPLITYQYIARNLGTEGFGKFSFSDSVIAYFMLFATLGVPAYAIREGSRIRENYEKLEQLCTELLSINLISTAMSYGLLFLAVLLIPRLQRDVLLTWILSINILTKAMGRDWINSIYEDFVFISFRYITFQGIAMVLLLLFVKSPEDLVLYTVIMLFANSGAYIANIFYTWRYVPGRFTWKLNLKTHLKPIIFLFFSEVAINIYVHSDVTVLGFFRPDSEVGIYSMASKVYLIIKALLNATIMVTIPRLSNYLGKNDIDRYCGLLGKLRGVLYTLVFPAITGLLCINKDIMLLIGGKAFLPGHEPLMLLCIALFFAVFGCYYASAVMIPLKKEKIYLIATLVAASVNIVLNIIIIPHLGMNGAAITTIFAEMIIVGGGIIAAKGLKVPFPFKDMASVIVGCLGIAGVCYITGLKVNSLIPRIVVTILVSSFVYGIVLLIMNNTIAKEGIRFISGHRRKKE